MVLSNVDFITEKAPETTEVNTATETQDPSVI